MKLLPVVIRTAGSARMGDNGKGGTDVPAAQLPPAGYAVAGVSSAVQAAIAFYPPTNFLTMDA